MCMIRPLEWSTLNMPIESPLFILDRSSKVCIIGWRLRDICKTVKVARVWPWKWRSSWNVWIYIDDLFRILDFQQYIRLRTLVTYTHCDGTGRPLQKKICDTDFHKTQLLTPSKTLYNCSIILVEININGLAQSFTAIDRSGINSSTCFYTNGAPYLVLQKIWKDEGKSVNLQWRRFVCEWEGLKYFLYSRVFWVRKTKYF